MSFGGDILEITETTREAQPARRAVINAALPGQMTRRALDAAAHRSQSVREAKRTASRWVAEDKWQRRRELWP